MISCRAHGTQKCKADVVIGTCGKTRPQDSRFRFGQKETKPGTVYRPGFQTQMLSGKEKMAGGLLREGSDCLCLVVLDVEHGVELRDLQQVMDLFGEVQQFEFAAAIADGGVSADQLADPGAVNVSYVAEVEQNMFTAFAEQVSNQVAQHDAALAQGNTAAQIDDGDAI